MRRGIRPFAVALALAALVVAIAAVLSSWWVLLALVPVAMMLGCATMMTAARGRMAGAPGAAGFGCCGTWILIRHLTSLR